MANKRNPHAAKVEEIREAFQEDYEHWEKIHKDGDLNMKFVAGDPWDPMDRQARESAGRPVVSFDELGQYLNQAQNEVRMTPSAPVFSPDGDGATNETAAVYTNAFRRMEYLSSAQDVYATAYDNALSRNVGMVRLKLDYEHARSFYQMGTIEPIPNTACCFPDSNSIKTDGADWKRFSFIEKYSKRDFKREFPKAEFTTFTVEQVASVGPMWMTENSVQVCEHWEVEETEAELVEYRVPATARRPERFIQMIAGKQRPPKGAVVVQRRVTTDRRVFSYFTNGVELLEKGGEVKHPYPGTMIPFAPCYGRVLWRNADGEVNRQIQSLVTLARDPIEAFCFLASCELEALGTITKNPYWAYEGQLTPELKNRIKQSLHEPVAVLEAKPFIPGREAAGLLPLPQRNPMSVDLSAYAMAKEGARRAIQAAIGMTPMMTPMQRDNQKLSGRALDKFQDAGQRGNFHFKDHYYGMQRRLAVLFEDVFDKITDVEREIMTVQADNQIKRVFVGGWDGKGQPPARPADLDKEVDFLPTTKGRHSLTVNIGPAKESERQESVEFLDTFITSPLFGALDPPKRDKLMGMAIKERLTGPIGQKMAEVVDPVKKDGEIPPEQVMAALQQAQTQIIPMLEAEIARLNQEREAKLVETQGRLAVAAKQDETKLAIAEMQTGQKREDTRVDSATDLAIAELRAEIEMLKLRQAERIKGAEMEHATAMTERGHAVSSAEGEKQRAAAASEGQANRDAAAQSQERDDE